MLQSEKQLFILKIWNSIKVKGESWSFLQSELYSERCF